MLTALSTLTLCLPFQLGDAQEADPPPQSPWEILKRSDADGDGRITLEEYGRGEERFLRLDLDGDGVITKADADKVGTTGPNLPKPKKDTAPKEGDLAPDFSLPLLGAKKAGTEIKLSTFRGKQPVALVFGSYT